MQKADEAVFHAFVSDRMDRWRRSAFLLCQDWHLADDALSTTLIRLYRNWSKVTRAENPEAYAHKVLTNCALTDRKRSSRRRELSFDETPEPASAPAHRADDRAAIASLLRSLGHGQRAVLILRFYLDHSVEETAEILGISPGTVKSQSARGLAALRAIATTQPY